MQGPLPSSDNFSNFKRLQDLSLHDEDDEVADTLLQLRFSPPTHGASSPVTGYWHVDPSTILQSSMPLECGSNQLANAFPHQRMQRLSGWAARVRTGETEQLLHRFPQTAATGEKFYISSPSSPVLPLTGLWRTNPRSAADSFGLTALSDAQYLAQRLYSNLSQQQAQQHTQQQWNQRAAENSVRRRLELITNTKGATAAAQKCPRAATLLVDQLQRECAFLRKTAAAAAALGSSTPAADDLFLPSPIELPGRSPVVDIQDLAFYEATEHMTADEVVENCFLQAVMPGYYSVADTGIDMTSSARQSVQRLQHQQEVHQQRNSSAFSAVRMSRIYGGCRRNLGDIMKSNSQSVPAAGAAGGLHRDKFESEIACNALLRTQQLVNRIEYKISGLRENSDSEEYGQTRWKPPLVPSESDTSKCISEYSDLRFPCISGSRTRTVCKCAFCSESACSLAAAAAKMPQLQQLQMLFATPQAQEFPRLARLKANLDVEAEREEHARVLYAENSTLKNAEELRKANRKEDFSEWQPKHTCFRTENLLKSTRFNSSRALNRRYPQESRIDKKGLSKKMGSLETMNHDHDIFLRRHAEAETVGDSRGERLGFEIGYEEVSDNIYKYCQESTKEPENFSKSFCTSPKAAHASATAQMMLSGVFQSRHKSKESATSLIEKAAPSSKTNLFDFTRSMQNCNFPVHAKNSHFFAWLSIVLPCAPPIQGSDETLSCTSTDSRDFLSPSRRRDLKKWTDSASNDKRAAAVSFFEDATCATPPAATEAKATASFCKNDASDDVCGAGQVAYIFENSCGALRDFQKTTVNLFDAEEAPFHSSRNEVDTLEKKSPTRKEKFRQQAVHAALEPSSDDRENNKATTAQVSKFSSAGWTTQSWLPPLGGARTVKVSSSPSRTTAAASAKAVAGFPAATVAINSADKVSQRLLPPLREHSVPLQSQQLLNIIEDPNLSTPTLLPSATARAGAFVDAVGVSAAPANAFGAMFAAAHAAVVEPDCMKWHTLLEREKPLVLASLDTSGRRVGAASLNGMHSTDAHSNKNRLLEIVEQQQQQQQQSGSSRSMQAVAGTSEENVFKNLKRADFAVAGGYSFLKHLTVDSENFSKRKSSASHEMTCLASPSPLLGGSFWRQRLAERERSTSTLVAAQGKAATAEGAAAAAAGKSEGPMLPFASVFFERVPLLTGDSASAKEEKKREEKYAYPENQFSPGYYSDESKAPTQQRRRQQIFMSIGDFRAREICEEEALKREKADLAEKEKALLRLRLAATTKRESEIRKAGELEKTPSAGKAVGGKRSLLTQALESLDVLELQQKLRYCKVLMGPGAEETMHYRHILAEKLGKGKTRIKESGVHHRPRFKSSDTVHRRNKLKKLVELHQKGGGAAGAGLLAHMLHEGASPYGKEFGKAAEGEESEESSESSVVSHDTVYTYSTVSSKYEYLESPPAYVAAAIRAHLSSYKSYQLSQLHFPKAFKARLSYSGLLLVEELPPSASTAVSSGKALAAPGLSPSRAADFSRSHRVLRQKLYVQAREEWFFFFVNADDTLREKVLSPHFHSKREQVRRVSKQKADGAEAEVPGFSEKWILLFGMYLDSQSTVENVSAPRPYLPISVEQPYQAVLVKNAVNMQNQLEAESGCDTRVDHSRVPRQERLNFLLSADSEEETLVWFALFTRRSALRKYAEHCGKFNDAKQMPSMVEEAKMLQSDRTQRNISSSAPSPERGKRVTVAQSVANFCFSAGNVVLNMKGMPYVAALDSVFFDALHGERKLSSFVLSSRQLKDSDAAAIAERIPFRAQHIDLRSNAFTAQAEPYAVCQLLNSMRAETVDLSDNDFSHAKAGTMLYGLLFETPTLKKILLNRTGMNSAVISKFAEHAVSQEAIGKTMRTTKALWLSDNNLTVSDVRMLLRLQSTVVLGLEYINISRNHSISMEDRSVLLSSSTSRTKQILSFEIPQAFSSDLEEPLRDGIVGLKRLPITFSGRLHAVGWTRCGNVVQLRAEAGGSSATAIVDGASPLIAYGRGDGAAAVADGCCSATISPLVYFELRGPALIYYPLAVRDESCWKPVKSSPGKKREEVPYVLDLGRGVNAVRGILLHHAWVDFDAHPNILNVQGFDIGIAEESLTAADMPLIGQSCPLPLTTYKLCGITETATVEWARIVVTRLAGIFYVRTELSAQRLLSGAVLQFFESCFSDTLDFEGCPVSAAALHAIFLHLCKYIWLRKIVLCNAMLDGSHIRSLVSAQAFKLFDLQLLDLSFNVLKGESDSDALKAVFCFRRCQKVVLDGNLLGDSPSFAAVVEGIVRWAKVEILCLNGCALGNTFAQAVVDRLRELPTAVEGCILKEVQLEKNFLSTTKIKALMDVFVEKVPTIERIRVHGNFFERAALPSNDILQFTESYTNSPLSTDPRLFYRKPRHIFPEEYATAAISTAHKELLGRRIARGARTEDAAARVSKGQGTEINRYGMTD